MANFAVYHALGQEGQDPSQYQQQPSPSQQQQQQQPYPSQSQQYPQQHPQQYPQQYSQQYPQHQPAGIPHPPGPSSSAPDPYGTAAAAAAGGEARGGVAELTSQMGGMSLAGDAGATVRRKKKDRHAYHTVEAPAGSVAPAFHGLPPSAAAGSPVPNQFIPADPAASAAAATANQFPVSVNPPFTPESASAAQFGARIPDPSPASAFGGASVGVGGGGGGNVTFDGIPSVPLARDSVQSHFFKHVYPTFERLVPPPAAVSFVALDQGNASPKFARLTMNSIPATSEGLAQTSLPLGAIIQPLARQQPGELPVPVLDFGDAGPPRCRRCRAYINPFMMFRSGGNSFVCNLCTYPNDTPLEYFCATTPQGVRVDRDNRPELMRGTIEFRVPKEYWTREPVPLNWLFLIDVTQEAYNKGYLEAFCDAIMLALYGSPDDDKKKSEGDDDDAERPRLASGTKVGFVTYDKRVHYYNCSPTLEQAQMLVMPDIEDPFVPLSQGLFVDPNESKAVIMTLLAKLPTMFAQVKHAEPALLAALKSVVGALEATGGKIIASLSALPTWGPGRLFLRDNVHGPSVAAGEPDKKLFTTEHPGWRKLAEKMTAAGVGVDFFLAAPTGGFLDLATIGHIAATTGGETFYYANFVAPRDNRKLALDVQHAVTRETGYQAVMKVRCSTGLQVAGYHGNFVQHTMAGADVEMGVIDADKAVTVTLCHDGTLDAKLDAHVQASLLYTTATGDRRVRCINMIASVSENARDSIKFVDQDAVCAWLAKDATMRLATTSATLREVRTSLSVRAIDILASYRRNFVAQVHPPSELVMPDRLKELSIFLLALTKSRAFKAGPEPIDRRVHEMRLLRAAGCPEISVYLYPRILPLHNLNPDEGFPDPETGNLHLPPAVRASFARLEPGGVYLVDNGQECLLWCEAHTSSALVQDLFGVGGGGSGDNPPADTTDPHATGLQALDPYLSSLPVLETHLNAQARNILEFLRTMRASKGLTIQLARHGLDGAELEFARQLVEDRNNNAQNYVDWLGHLHKGVQLELAGQRKREDTGEGTSFFGGLRPAIW